MANEVTNTFKKSLCAAKHLFVTLLLLACAVGASAQAVRNISGTVIDEITGEPLIGVSVVVKNSNFAVATDIDGKYVVKAAKGNTIEFSYVGYLTQSIVVGERSTVNVSLKEDTQKLDEVVVIAYGAQKKTSVTGAITQVNSEAIEKRPVSSVAAAIEGNSPGITVTGNYGAAGESPTIRIRGVGTVNGSTSPLYVLDGAPFDGSITDINPDDVESISVLKDAASAALYGNRAANGVILITTKKAKQGDKVSITFKTTQGVYQRGISEYNRLGANQWMTAMYTALRNYQYSKNLEAGKSHADALAAATTYAQQNTIADIAKLNIYNVDDDQLFNADGSLVAGAQILSGYQDDLDWYDQVIQNGYRGEYSLSGQGASDRSDYYFSINYLDENGYVKSNNYSRLSGRAAINVRPTKWLATGLNISGTYQKTSNVKGNGDDASSYTNAFNYCRSIAPIYPVHLHYTKDGYNDAQNGEYILASGEKQWDPGYYTYTNEEEKKDYTVETRSQNTGRHMIYENELNSDVTKRKTLNSTAYAEVYLPYGFVATVRGNLNLRTSNNQTYESAVIGDAQSSNGRYKYVNYEYRSYTFQQQLRWSHTFNGLHSVSALLGHENYDYKYTYKYERKQDEILPFGNFATNFTTLTAIEGYANQYKTESYLARVQYNYNDLYNVEASYRRDGSSRFADGHRWGNFGSIGANWIFSNEEFMKDYTWLNHGKLRADWGLVANDAAAGYYSYMSLLTVDKYGGQGAFVVSQYPAEDLTWETGESWGIGLESYMFNRWKFNIEFYHKTNRDLIFSVNDPSSVGGTSASYSSAYHDENFGSIVNYGIEIDTDVDIFKNKDWRVNFAANLSTLKNKVTELPEAYKEEGYRSGSYLIEEGKSRYEWNTYTYCGVDMTNGNALYAPNLDTYYIEDGDNLVGNTETGTKLASTNWVKIGDQYYVYNPTSYGSRTYKGTALPSVFGSFTGSFTYKNFSLSAMFTYSLGGKVMDSVYSSLMSFSGNATSMHEDCLNSWTPDMMVSEDSSERLNTSINPQIHQEQYSTNNATSDRWLISRNYIVFKNLNCSYRLPRSFTRKLDINNATVSFSCENLFTKTARKGMDAQQSLGGGQSNYLTTPRVFTFGLTLNI